MPANEGINNWEGRLRKRWQKTEQALRITEGFQGYAFRFLALAFVFGVEVALFWAVFKNINIGAGMLTAITIIAVLPIIVIRAFDISVLNLGKEGIQADFQVERLRTEVNEVLSKIDRLFVRTMSEPLFKRLSSLAGEKPVSDTVNDSLSRQLNYLADIGYIEVLDRPLPESGKPFEDLRNYVRVTKTGREFIELRESVARSSVS